MENFLYYAWVLHILIYYEFMHLCKRRFWNVLSRVAAITPSFAFLDTHRPLNFQFCVKLHWPHNFQHWKWAVTQGKSNEGRTKWDNNFRGLSGRCAALFTFPSDRTKQQKTEVPVPRQPRPYRVGYHLDEIISVYSFRAIPCLTLIRSEFSSRRIKWREGARCCTS